MLVENYIRLDGWLNIRTDVSPSDWRMEFETIGSQHTLTDARKLYDEYMASQPERLNPEASKEDVIV